MNDNGPISGGGAFITLEPRREMPTVDLPQPHKPVILPPAKEREPAGPGGQSCGTCNAFAPNRQANPKAGEARQGWCRAKPPLMVQTMVELPGSALQPSGPRMVPGYQGLFPPTADDAWCREWQAKLP